MTRPVDGSNVVAWRPVPQVTDDQHGGDRGRLLAPGANVVGWRAVRNRETSYYMLVADATMTAGQTVADRDDDGDPMQVVSTSPRALSLCEVEERYEIEDQGDEITARAALVLGQLDPPLRLVRLEPRGDVTPWVDSRVGADGEPEVFDHPTDVVCAQGWTVAELLALDPVLGPQAAHLVAVVREAERVLVRYEDEAAVNAYIAAYNPQHEQAERCAEAAEAALDAIGADGWWWRQLGACAYGHEVLALAARDLIGTTADWTQDAYDVLTRPWRAAFGRPVHPDDAAYLPDAPATTTYARPLGPANPEGSPR